MGVYGGNYGANYDTGVPVHKHVPHKASIPFTYALQERKEPEIIDSIFAVPFNISIIAQSFFRQPTACKILKGSFFKIDHEIKITDPTFKLSELKKGRINVHNCEITTTRHDVPAEIAEVLEVLEVVELLDMLESKGLI